MTELYIYVVTILRFDCNNSIVDYMDITTDLFTTEKKAIDFCINNFIEDDYINYNNYLENNKDINILSLDEYINTLKEKTTTIKQLKELCKFEEDIRYKDRWYFQIVKRRVDPY